MLFENNSKFYIRAWAEFQNITYFFKLWCAQNFSSHTVWASVIDAEDMYTSGERGDSSDMQRQP